MAHGFKQGESGNPAGRPKGAIGKLNRTVKETVLNVFNKLQEDDKHNLEAFATKYPRDFYQIAAKLIPTEMIGSGVMRFIISPMKKGQIIEGEEEKDFTE